MSDSSSTGFVSVMLRQWRDISIQVIHALIKQPTAATVPLELEASTSAVIVQVQVT